MIAHWKLNASTLHRKATGRDVTRWPFAGLVVVLALQFSMVFTRAINWDEFYHYSLVELFSRGTLTQPLQTFFVRLFQWLLLLAGTGADHIVAARLVMFACELVTVGAIVALAGRFANRTVGILCALGYLSVGYVLQHGASFRADPVDAALLMSALWVLGGSRFRGPWVALFGALGALAAIYTIKSVFYAPAFIGLAWLRWSEEQDKRGFLTNLTVASGLAAMLFAALLFLHSRTVPDAAGGAGTMLHASADKMLSVGSPLYRVYLVRAAITAPLFALLIVAVPFSLRSASVSAARKVALFGLWLPILVLGLYQNTAPYFYAFILPPVAVACSVPLSRLLTRARPEIVAAVFAGLAFVFWVAEDRTVIDKQRTLLRAADAIFPARVAYFDFCAMLGRDDKANVFMTTFGSELYREGYWPSMRETMRQKAVPLVVEDDPMFTRLLRTSLPTPEFLADDAAAVRETYLPFWGPFWVAGKVVAANSNNVPASILVPGPYTLSGAATEVDGRVIRPGEVVNLDRGMHRFTAIDGKAARLTWGAHLHAPAEPPPPEPYWVWF